MLGSLVGGYGDASTASSVLALWPSLGAFGSFPAFLFGRGWIVPTLLLGGVFMVYLGRRPRPLPAALMLLIGVLGPLLPLAVYPGFNGPDRYLFLVWLVVSLTGVVAMRAAVQTLEPAKGLTLGLAMCALPLGWALHQTRDVARQQAPLRSEIETQGRFIDGASAPQGLLVSDGLLASHWYAVSLCQIKQRLGQACPVLVIRGLPAPGGIERLYRYERATASLKDVSANLDAELAASASVDTTRPLQAWISLQDGVVRWHLGPHEQGRYVAVSPALGRYPLARSGELRTVAPQLLLSIQFDASEGWSTASPLLVVRPGQPLDWARPAKP